MTLTETVFNMDGTPDEIEQAIREAVAKGLQLEGVTTHKELTDDTHRS